MKKKLWYGILTIVLFSGIIFFGCDGTFGTGGDLNNFLPGQWRLSDTGEAPEGIGVRINFSLHGRFSLEANMDVALILEMLQYGKVIQEVCPECDGSGYYYYGDECYYCGGTGYIDSEIDMNFFENFDLTELKNLKTITLEVRGTYTDNGDTISVYPTGIKSNAFGAAISVLRSVYNEMFSELFQDTPAYISDLVNIINIPEIFNELNKNLSGWVEAPQIKNFLDYLLTNVDSSLKTRLAKAGLTENDLQNMFGGDEENEEDDLDPVLYYLYFAKINIKEAIDNMDDLISEMLAEAIPPIPYELNDGLLFISEMDMTFTR